MSLYLIASTPTSGHHKTDDTARSNGLRTSSDTSMHYVNVLKSVTVVMPISVKFDLILRTKICTHIIKQIKIF